MEMSVHPYIVLDGKGKEAVKFYEEVLGAKIVTYQSFRDMEENPDYPIPEDAKDRVMHAALKIGQTQLMISDTMPDHSYQLGNQLNIALVIDNPEKSKEAYNKLQNDGGKVDMPLQETSWSVAYGQVTDKYGITWLISTDLKDR